MFESLGDRLSGVFDRLRGRGADHASIFHISIRVELLDPEVATVPHNHGVDMEDRRTVHLDERRFVLSVRRSEQQKTAVLGGQDDAGFVMKRAPITLRECADPGRRRISAIATSAAGREYR